MQKDPIDRILKEEREKAGQSGKQYEKRLFEDQMLQVKQFIQECTKCVVIAGEQTLYNELEEENLILRGDEGTSTVDERWKAQDLAMDYILNKKILSIQDLYQNPRRF